MADPHHKSAGDASTGCHGYTLVASDGPCGTVETPLFPPDSSQPDFLAVRIGDRIQPRFPLVPIALVEDVDTAQETVRIAATADEIRHLPEMLPLAR